MEKKKRHKKYTIEEVRKIFEEGGCELLSKEYINIYALLDYICNCNSTSKISLNNFKQEKRCQKCGIKKMIEKQKYSFCYVKQYFENKKCELLEKEYINVKTAMKYKCQCGEISRISFSDFKNGTRCKKCAGVEKYTLEYVQWYFKDHGCELLEKYYIKNTDPMRYKCQCGEISRTSFWHFRNGIRCKKCGIKKMSGKNSNLWKSSITDEERFINRNYIDYKKWRTSVYERDNYTCQHCNTRGCILNAHHIESYANNRTLRINIQNGITLCKICHKKFHKMYGGGNNTKEQFNEFMRGDIKCQVG